MKTLFVSCCAHIAALGVILSGYCAERPNPVLSENLKPLERTIGEWEVLLPNRPGGGFMGAGVAQREDGVLITAVDPGRPADKAGLKAGDLVVELRGQKVTDVQEYLGRIRETQAGSKLPLRIRRDGQIKEIEVTLIERPSPGYIGIFPPRDGAPNDVVVVGTVRRGSPGEEAGLKVGDRIVEFKGERVTDWTNLTERVFRSSSGEKVLLKFKRDDKIETVQITIGEQPQPGQRTAEIGAGGQTILTQGGPRSEIWYFDPASKQVTHLMVFAVGAVWKGVYSKETLATEEYSASYEITSGNGDKGTAVFHTKWNGANEFSTWISDRIFAGEEPRPSGPSLGTPVRQTFRRVKGSD